MSLGTLGKKLQRDLKANPKKGLLLLLMVCGAGYFWGPILKRWVGGKSGQPGTVAAAPVILDDPKPAQAAAGKFKPPSWEKLQEFLQQDGRTKPAELPAEFRDPFAVAALLEEQTAETTPAENPQQSATPVRNPLARTNTKSAPIAGADSGPEELALKVTSVSIGPRGRMASIGGEVVWEGDTFEPDVGAAESEAKVSFVIRRIEPWGVLLECAGTEYKAVLPQPQLKNSTKNKNRLVRETPASDANE